MQTQELTVRRQDVLSPPGRISDDSVLLPMLSRDWAQSPMIRPTRSMDIRHSTSIMLLSIPIILLALLQKQSRFLLLPISELWVNLSSEHNQEHSMVLTGVQRQFLTDSGSIPLRISIMEQICGAPVSLRSPRLSVWRDDQAQIPPMVVKHFRLALPLRVLLRIRSVSEESI